MNCYFLYNPLAGKGKAEKIAQKLKFSNTGSTYYLDLTQIRRFDRFVLGLEPEDMLVICGGDGTLNRFINATQDVDIPNDILYCPAGSGNDFMNDIVRTEEDGAFDVKPYLQSLPCVTIKGKQYRLINGVGFGVDGFVCAEGARLRSAGKKVNYTTIALKALLFSFRPVSAFVTVDGVGQSYDRVWMTTTMKGRFFGGGMMIAPDQKRDDPQNRLSVVVVHNLSKLRILSLFPHIFNGTHTKFTDFVSIKRCHSIHVKYDRPCYLQIDGEPISGVTEYFAEANACVPATV